MNSEAECNTDPLILWDRLRLQYEYYRRRVIGQAWVGSSAASAEELVTVYRGDAFLVCMVKQH